LTLNILKTTCYPEAPRPARQLESSTYCCLDRSDTHIVPAALLQCTPTIQPSHHAAESTANCTPISCSCSLFARRQAAAAHRRCWARLEQLAHTAQPVQQRLLQRLIGASVAAAAQLYNTEGSFGCVTGQLLTACCARSHPCRSHLREKSRQSAAAACTANQCKVNQFNQLHVFLARGGNQRGGPLSNHQWWVPNQPAQRLTSRGQSRSLPTQKPYMTGLP
jgi:hypothetical protein